MLYDPVPRQALESLGIKGPATLYIRDSLSTLLQAPVLELTVEEPYYPSYTVDLTADGELVFDKTLQVDLGITPAVALEYLVVDGKPGKRIFILKSEKKVITRIFRAPVKPISAVATYREGEQEPVVINRIEELCREVTATFREKAARAVTLFKQGKITRDGLAGVAQLAMRLGISSPADLAACNQLFLFARKQMDNVQFLEKEAVNRFIEKHAPMGLLPVDLVMEKQLVVTRPGNSQEMTELLRNEGSLELVIQGCTFPRNEVPISARVHLMVTPAIEEVLVKGGVIRYLSLVPPDRSSGRMEMNVMISGTEEMFGASQSGEPRDAALVNVKGASSNQVSCIAKDVPRRIKERIAAETSAYRTIKEVADNTVSTLPALPVVRADPVKAIAVSREKIRKKEGDLIIPKGRKGKEIRACLGITSAPADVYLKLVRDEVTGYPLLQHFPSRPNGTTSTKIALSEDYRFIIPPNWREDLSLFPGQEADIVVYRDERNSTYAIITPAVTATYRTALLFPVPAFQKDKRRERDTSIKNAKLWQTPPPTLDELEKDKKQLFVFDPATGKPVDREAVKHYLEYKQEIVTTITNLCQQVTDRCIGNFDTVLDLCRGGGVTQQGTGATAQINKLLGDQSTLNQAISLVLAGKARAYLTSVIRLEGTQPDGKIKEKTAKKKVSGTRDSLSSWFAGHPEKWFEFLLFERSPFTETYLARQWSVSRTFTRNFLHGIRYRLDKHLPEEMQLKQPLRPFTEQSITDACQQLVKDINQFIADRLKEEKHVDSSRAFLNKVKTIEQYATGIIAFLNGCPLLGGPITIGWKPLKERSEAIVTYLLQKKNANYHSALRAVLSLAAADPNGSPLAVTLQGLGVEEMTPDRCLVKPFKSEKRNNITSRTDYRNSYSKSKLQPLNLVMSSNHVIYRPDKGIVLTALLASNGVIELQVPRFSRDRNPLIFYLPASHGMLQAIERGAKVQMLRLHPPSGPSRKIKVDVALTGPPWAFASTKHLALENYCPVCWTRHPLGSTCQRCNVPVVPATLPEDTHLGIDLNKVGKYMVAFSTGDLRSAASQLSLLTLDTIKHYNNAKKELSEQQKARAKREKRLTSKLSTLLTVITPDLLQELLSLTASGMDIHPLKDFIKQRGITGKNCASLTTLGYNTLGINNQIALLHARIKHLRKALHELTTREIAIQLLLIGATTLACENLAGLDVTGKKGTIAIATLDMPDEPAVIIRAIRNVNAYYRALGIHLEVVIDPVDPRGTSSIHAGCGSKLERSPGKQWDMAKCKKCGKNVNTHVNAALNVKFLSQGKLLVPVPAPDPSPSTPAPPPPPAPPPMP